MIDVNEPVTRFVELTLPAFEWRWLAERGGEPSSPTFAALRAEARRWLAETSEDQQ